MDAKALKTINARLERIEITLGLDEIELPIEESEEALSNKGLDAIFGEWEEEGIQSKLANIIVAPENVAKAVAGDIGTEYDGKMYFTWDEAMELEEKVLKPNGWRLPTRSEWVLLAEEFGQDENGTLGGELFKKTLKLPAAGFLSSGIMSYKDVNAFYWSSVPDDNIDVFCLFCNSRGGLSPQYKDCRQYGFAVRCVKDIKEGE